MQKVVVALYSKWWWQSWLCAQSRRGGCSLCTSSPLSSNVFPTLWSWTHQLACSLPISDQPSNGHPVTAICKALSICRPNTSHTFPMACRNSIQCLTGQVLPVYTQVTHPGNPLGPPALPWRSETTLNDTVSRPSTVESSILCIWHKQPISYITCYSSVQPFLGKWNLFWASCTKGVKTEWHRLKLDKHFSQQK
jgi:hypothetical protein